MPQKDCSYSSGDPDFVSRNHIYLSNSIIVQSYFEDLSQYILNF